MEIENNGSIEIDPRIVLNNRKFLPRSVISMIKSLCVEFNKPQRLKKSLTLALLSEDERSRLMCPISNFLSSEFLERLAMQVVLNEAYSKGYLDGNDVNKYMF